MCVEVFVIQYTGVPIFFLIHVVSEQDLMTILYLLCALIIALKGLN